MEPKAQEKKPFTKRHAVLFTLLSVVLAAAILFGTMLLSGAAGADLSASRNEENEEYLNVIAHNVEYGEYIHLYYALDLNLPEGARAEDVRMLFWNAPQESYDKDNENILYSVSGKLGDKIEMGEVVYESPYLFRSKGIAPKEIGDTIYARAYVTDSEGNTYYSRVDKFGVLQYVHAMYRTKELGYTVTDDQMHLYATILNYGTRAQRIFNYKTDRLVSDHTVRIEAVNGVGADGFSTGIYFVGDTVTLTANEAPEGQAFVRWENAAGEVVSEEETFTFEVSEETKSEVYSVVYSTAGLVYTLQSDDTYSVTGYNGTDTNVIMPRKYLGKSVAKIGNNAFYNKAITKVDIPSSVTSIGNSAFSNCRSLTSVTFSGNSQLQTIGSRAFEYCFSLASMTIGDGVTSIGYQAFYDCRSLASIKIPDSVTKIGDSAFNYCYNLTSITVDENNTAYKSIDGNLYSKDGKRLILYAIKKSNTTFVIPDSVTSIVGYAFYGCKSLTSVTIPDSVTSIGKYAFAHCNSLRSITIPNSVTIIDADAFNGCTNLTSVTFSENSQLKSISVRAFEYCESLMSVTIPASVTSIDAYAFRYCSSLASVTMPDSVTSVGESAFYHCNSALYTEYEYGKYIGDEDNPYQVLIELTNENMSTYTIHEDTKHIASKVFYYHTTLTSIVIPDGVTSIGSSSFVFCDNLTSVTIPGSVTSINAFAFQHCSSLVSVYISDIAAWCDISFHENYSNPLLYAKNLYLDDELITNLVIPDGVTSIGEYVFRGYDNLASVTIPDSVTSIGSSAFLECYKLVEVINNSSLNIVAGSSNYGYVARYAKIVHNGESKIVNKDDYLFITLDGVNYLLGYVGNDTDIALPESYNGENYVINDRAFYGCTSLTSVTIPDSVTSIGSFAFSYCTSLTRVTIPGNVTSIGGDVFTMCTNLTIYCEAGSHPSGWNTNWNYSNCPVVWGYTADAE